MEPVRATLEADLAVAPLLSHSIPESLEIITNGRQLPRLPMFQINLYEARSPRPAAIAFADHVRRSIAQSGAEGGGRRAELRARSNARLRRATRSHP
jgi:hypothetical protein